MSTFKFNFSGDDNTQAQDESNEDIQWLECVEVIPESQITKINDIMAARAQMFTCGDVEIGHVIAKEAVLRIGDNSLKSAVELAEKEHSDLVTGKYEGGLKIWECTSDLIELLVENPDKIKFSISKVLDLGCGAGILGIYTFMNGAHVTFQDYNKEVLEYVTIPNVLLNIEDGDECEVDIAKCKFYAGDWGSFNQKLDDSELYDLILTSETIYNPDNYDKLLQLFMQRLTKDGIAYVAAKTYYFGVGGGVKKFQQVVEGAGLLKCEVCWKSLGGIQREILKITRTDLLLID